MERRYFRANKLMESPAAAGGNSMENDLMSLTIKGDAKTHWFTYKNHTWITVLSDQLPNEFKVLLLIGAI